MHSVFWSWRRARRAFGNCSGFGGWHGHAHKHDRDDDEAGEDWGGGLGVRRPLRFLVHKLDLDERQIAEMARVLNELKTERAQAEVDRRRTVASFADALGGDTFDSAKATEAGALRVQTAERVRDAVLKALQQIHVMLNPDQRARLAYLIRTGALML